MRMRFNYRKYYNWSSLGGAFIFVLYVSLFIFHGTKIN